MVNNEHVHAQTVVFSKVSKKTTVRIRAIFLRFQLGKTGRHPQTASGSRFLQYILAGTVL